MDQHRESLSLSYMMIIYLEREERCWGEWGGDALVLSLARCRFTTEGPELCRLEKEEVFGELSKRFFTNDSQMNAKKRYLLFLLTTVYNI